MDEHFFFNDEHPDVVFVDRGLQCDGDGNAARLFEIDGMPAEIWLSISGYFWNTFGGSRYGTASDWMTAARCCIANLYY